MDRQTMIIKAFFEFCAVLLTKSMAIAKALRRQIAATEKSNDFIGLQDLAVAWSKISNKINKIRRAQQAFDIQQCAIRLAYATRSDDGLFRLTSAQALKIIGDFSQPSKMPGYGYSLPAAACMVGQCLRRVAGSVCARCYAHKGNYNYIEVLANLYRRLIAIQDLDLWYVAMCTAIRYVFGGGRYKKSKKFNDLGFFRWHDSGDLQSLAHLAKIVDIARQFPMIRFWLPTKESKIVNEFMKLNDLPDNLIIRVSAPMIGQVKFQPMPLCASAVDAPATEKYQWIWHCPAPKTDGACGTCRACWSRTYPIVSYHAH